MSLGEVDNLRLWAGTSEPPTGLRLSSVGVSALVVVNDCLTMTGDNFCHMGTLPDAPCVGECVLTHVIEDHPMLTVGGCDCDCVEHHC
jgi:hypothetical protein